MMQRFQYHTLAVGLSGHISHPYHEAVPIRASVALVGAGGAGANHAERFCFRDIVSFEAAHSIVSGSYSEQDRSYESVATTIIEGLDIMGVVTARRIVARIAASHPADGSEPSITPHGSCFEDLRIAGHSPTLKLAVDTFGELDTMSSIRNAFREDKDGFRDKFRALSLVNRGDHAPAPLRHCFPSRAIGPHDEVPEHEGAIHCSLVRSLTDLGPELVWCGHAIHVKGFGVVRLAEFTILNRERRIAMLEVNLGSSPKGNLSAGTAAGNGSGW